MKEKVKTVSLRLPEALHQKMCTRANEEGKLLTTIYKEALERYLGIEKKAA